MAQPKLNIVCFYWQGGITSGWGNTILGIEYVNRLYRSISRNLTSPFKFTCFLQEGIQARKLMSEINIHRFSAPVWEGRLPKLYAFSKGNGLEGRVVIVDMDLIIVGNLDEMFAYNGKFMTRGEPGNPNISGGDIVFFEAGSFSNFWDDLVKDPAGVVKKTKGSERYFYRQWLNGDQDFVEKLYPGQWMSYKFHIRRGNLTIPKNCCLISCHGHPKPHELAKLDWIQRYWK